MAIIKEHFEDIALVYVRPLGGTDLRRTYVHMHKLSSLSRLRTCAILQDVEIVPARCNIFSGPFACAKATRTEQMTTADNSKQSKSSQAEDDQAQVPQKACLCATDACQSEKPTRNVNSFESIKLINERP